MLTLRTDRGRTLSVVRCDIADVASVLDGHTVTPANAENFEHGVLEHIRTARTSSSMRQWYGGIASMEEATALFTQGWKDGAEKAQQLAPRLQGLVPPPKPIRKRMRWAEEGTELNVERALAGEWERAWRNTGPHKMQPRVLSLACAFGGNAHRTHEELFWCAAQMIVVTMLLEEAGYSVELHALESGRTAWEGSKTMLTDVLVKEAGQPLRADSVAAIFGHAGVFRTFGFALICSHAWNVGYGLGSMTPTAPLLEHAVEEGLALRPDYLFEAAYSLSSAAENITKALGTLTGEVAS
jgi:hypothetical protein